ncbi:hypothetical protein HNP55_004077 [Paucibacter oligotrophus]|uniref:Uncharacterized protein n=1 Tax=Roseateles oligotrophus TaxID=1769250 RepID=A0A840LEV3_9BURK|nr:hypothetical protein [Roseateles oligotrophus]MBB4845525.1 hypothetical protein [Roseateles oligotrophus]
MSSAPVDVAQLRLDNAMLLFEEFVAVSVKHPDPATLRGLERRFAERLQIQPSYWSQIKSRSRQIGERLARQFEQLFHKPPYWMDQPHGAAKSGQDGALAAAADQTPSMPQDDDERFIVGLVLTYYRRHPQRARSRLLDLLGEVLTPPAASASPTPPARAGKTERPVAIGAAAQPAKAAPDELDDWRRLQQGIAPLKPKKR